MNDYYTEYIQARNKELYKIMVSINKEELIKLILERSSDEYLDNMYGALVGLK